MSPFPFHIHGAAGTWPFPTKYTSQIRGCKDHAQAPQQFTELHLAPWKQEAAEKSWWTMESGFPNEKNRMREKERERESAAASGGNLLCYSPEVGASPTQQMGGSRPDNQQQQ